YSARVGLVLYGNTVDVTSTSGTISEDVRTIEPDGNETAAIWEPNNFEHTPYVVANNGMGITSTSEYVLTYAIKSTITGSVDNIYDITDTTNLSPVYTNIPQYNELGETMYEEYFTTGEGTSQLGLKPNAISKVRVYIWLEGQDPDCVDLASTGDKLNVELRLTKDENELRDEVTYDEETQLETEPGTILTASEVRAVDYGKYLVEYELANVTNEELGIGGWKIFHSDGTNIYLIADDYIYSEAFQLSDIANDIGYMDSYDINSELKAQWLRKYTYLSGMENIKATALLLDAWYWEDSFGKNNDTEYIIGGPTLELFTASYNATHSERKIRTKVSDYTGYTVRWNDGDWDDYIEGVDSLEGLYIINDTTKAEGMWIASPYADSDNLLPQETGINMAVARRFRNRRGKM
ncbi:MAG: hypothetical protein IJZ96_08235, partial [Lachnospiraceae bacterium]|nr:hypothetical protein [Lachnospiraceae bacterium]